MCGRYALHTSPEVIALLHGVQAACAWAPRYNIAPTQFAPIVRLRPVEGAVDGRGSTREMAIAKWGLIPGWAKDPGMGARMNNARAETVAEKPAFRAAFKRRRCLIPVDGWYEWKEEGGRKQPYFLHVGDNEVSSLAGLWEEWISPDGSPVESFAVITTEANEDAAKVHDRMPVIIEAAQFPLWLEGDVKDVATLLRPLQQGKVRFHKVDRRMSSARVDDASCMAPSNEQPASGPAEKLPAEPWKQGSLL